MFLSDISLKRPIFAIVVIIALLAVGVISFMGLNLNDMPQAEMPYVSISVILPGASPDQMESKVTKEIEDAVGQISGVKHLTSNISDSFSITVIEFDDSIHPEDAAQEVRAKLSSIRNSLPGDIEEPLISKIDINESPILSLAVTGEMSKAELSALVNKVIVPKLNTVSGVGSVTVYGLLEKEIQVKVDKDRLSSYHLTINQVLAGLSSDNLDTPSGKISGDTREMSLRTYSSITEVKGFGDIAAATVNGAEIKLKDFAAIAEGYKNPDSISYYNGLECIGLDIVKQSGTNTVAVTDKIKSTLDQISETLPEGAEISIVSDNSNSIRSSVQSVEKTMVEGCILAVLIIFLFLRTVSSTMISALALPTSIIATFAGMKLMGFTLNTISLLSLSLSVGLLVDDAIVVIENIARHMKMGKTPYQAAKEATGEISLAVLATTLTIVAVFLPMAIMGGIIGPFFREFGLTIAFAVLVSLFVSFTLVPLMSAKYLKEEDESEEPKTRLGRYLLQFNHQFDKLAVSYQKVLELALGHRKKTLVVTAASLVLSLALIPAMGVAFTPSQDEGTISINAVLDSGLSLNAAAAKAKEIEAVVAEYKEVQSTYTTVEKDSITIQLALAEKKNRKLSSDEIAAKMREDLREIPGLDLSLRGSTSITSAGGKSFSFHMQGDDFDELVEYSQQAKQLLTDIPGAVDVGISYKAGKPETRIVVDRTAASDQGVAPSGISAALGVLFNGVAVGQYSDEDGPVDVTLGIEDAQGSTIDSIQDIYVTSSTTGNPVPIHQVTKKEYGTASSIIDRYDKMRDIQIQANAIHGMSTTELNQILLEKLNAELPPPEGISFVAGSDQALMEESMSGIIQAVVLGVLFIFLILAAQFESWIDPLAIMFSLPLAIIGAILALFVSGAGITVIGLIGVIFLMGLVTKNAILLVDFIKTRRKEGQDRRVAILEAGIIRLRPIMMTTLAMVFGMLPSALDSGIGSEMRQPMAIAIIGGLISSTLLTLIVVPVIYTVLDDLKHKSFGNQDHS